MHDPEDRGRYGGVDGDTHSHGGMTHSHGHDHPHSHPAGLAEGQAIERRPRLYRGFPARPQNGGRLYHGIAVALPPMGRAMLARLKDVFEEPFTGIATPGGKERDLHRLVATGTSIAAQVAAARAYLAKLRRLDFQQFAVEPLDSPDRRRWINAFPDWMPTGVWLADLAADEREAALALLESCLSAKGYAEVRSAMKINQALGEFIEQAQDTITEYGFFLTLFGTPHEDRPWGWRLMGYHLTIYCTFVAGQMVLTPSFVGAEMAVIDDGPYAGVSVLQAEQQAGLELAASLDPAQRARAVLYPSMRKADLPPELGGFDGRVLSGAGQDNRVIPYAGLPAAMLSAGQRELLLRLVGLYVGRMAEPHATLKMRQVEQHLDRTFFAWIGDPDRLPFYYRIHSAVVLIEFDHHSGIFIANDHPEPFHIHTVVRTPNGNDYGLDYLGQHLRHFRHGEQPDHG